MLFLQQSSYFIFNITIKIYLLNKHDRHQVFHFRLLFALALSCSHSLSLSLSFSSSLSLCFYHFSLFSRVFNNRPRPSETKPRDKENNVRVPLPQIDSPPPSTSMIFFCFTFSIFFLLALSSPVKEKHLVENGNDIRVPKNSNVSRR